LRCVITSPFLRDAEIIDEVEARGDAQKAVAVHDDSDEAAAEQRDELADWRIGRNGFETRHHHLFHW